jgi:acetolactate synthase-1/2/3 large subunit
MNIQRVQIECPPPVELFRERGLDTTKLENIDVLVNAIATAKRPLILAGGGVNAARARASFLEFVALCQMPVVTSLLGLDLMPYDHPLRVGFIGSYGNRWANIAFAESDLLLVLGSRLDIRQTGADTQAFAANKTIIHVDCDIGEINNRIPGCIPMVTDLQVFFDLFFAKTKANLLSKFSCDDWIAYILKLKAQWPDLNELKDVQGINPNVFIHALSQSSQVAVGYSVDVGSHQMWSAQSLEILKSQLFVTSAGMGAMGYALPAAMGFSFACQKQPVVVIVGDGCLQMNIQELQTIVRNQLPIKIIVLNNQSLGMIRQFQDSYFDSRYQSTYWGYSAPNFEAVAQAYGITAKTISQDNEIHDAMHWLWADPKQPALLQVMIEPSLHVYPKIAFGRPITDMEPFVKPLEMEGT